MSEDGGLRGRLATRAEAATQEQQSGDGAPVKRTIFDVINAQKAEIARALPKHMNAERLTRIVTTTLRQNPKLMECSSASLLGAVMLSAQLGLEPGPLGHAWFVPFYNSRLEWRDPESGQTRKGMNEVQWILGYKGIIELAYRSGKLLSIEAREVCAHDEFDFAYGLEPKLHHKPNMHGDRGDPICYYGVAHFKDGGRYFVVLPISEIEKHRSRSKAAEKDGGPWKTDYDAMARKTVIRVMAPFLPLSAEFAAAVAHDESVERRIDEDLLNLPAERPMADDRSHPVIEGEIQLPADVATETGEVASDQGPEPDTTGPDLSTACPHCGAVEGEPHDESVPHPQPAEPSDEALRASIDNQKTDGKKK